MSRSPLPPTRRSSRPPWSELTTGHVASVADPFTTGTVSPDGRTAYAVVSYDRPAVELTAADEDAMHDAVATLEDAGLTVAVGGDAFAEQATAAGAAEGIGILVALVVLVITFGSLVAAGLPLLTAIIGVSIGILGVTILTGFLELSSTTPALATMLGLAVGIDYALFVMSRYRHEVSAGREPEEAAGRAIGTAGSAVVFAGLTVVIALAGLSITGITFLTQMGLAGAATVAVAVAIALTLLPALLAYAGRRVTSATLPGLKNRDPEGDDVRTNGRRWVDLVTRFRVPALVAGLAVAAVISLPLASMELALPDDGSAPADTGRRQAYDLIAANFGEGANGPLTVVVDTQDAADPAAAVDAAVAIAAGVPDDVAAVIPPVVDPSDEQADGVRATARGPRLRDHHGGPRERAVRRRDQGARRHPARRVRRTARRDRCASPGHRLRRRSASTSRRASPTPSRSTCSSSSGSRSSCWCWSSARSSCRSRRPWGSCCPCGIALGATVAVFQWGWLNELIGLDATAPVVFILPLLLTGILFGLAMDYEVFLVTRMREEYVHGSPARQAVVIGFQHSARVVTAAAIIMVGVFGGFAIGEDPIIKTIGFALAVGVLADAFLVRMTIVPAVMAIVGARMWWLPRWLDRLLPDLDIEGESLGRRLAAARQE